MCIELVNIQKFYFLFPLEELHFVSKFTNNGFYFMIFSIRVALMAYYVMQNFNANCL